MHPIRPALVAAAILLVGMSSVGCSAEAGPTPPAPGASATTQGTLSEAEALTRARAAYTGYIRAVEVMGAAGESDIDALRPFVVTDSLENEVEGIQEVAAEGLALRGNAKVEAFEVQTYEPAEGTLTAYACVDLSRLRVVDADGEDVTPASRPDRQTSVPHFRVADGTMKVVKDTTWSGASIC